jgi:hypothetical protein
MTDDRWRAVVRSERVAWTGVAVLTVIGFVATDEF